MKPLSPVSCPLLALLGGALVCLWLLLQVCAGATDLREEMRALGLD